MVDETDILTRLEGLAAAFNARDIDAVMGLFASDCSLDMPRGSEPHGTRCQGFAEVRKGLLTRFESTPDVHYSDLEHFVSGNSGMSKWLLTGIRMDGEKVRVRGCDFYTFRDGLVVRKDSLLEDRNLAGRELAAYVSHAVRSIDPMWPCIPRLSIARLDPATQAYKQQARCPWMAGSSAAMELREG